jgi:4-alpha-glucanotransferase
MSDDALIRLAQAAGISASWKDVFGKTHEVEPPTLRAVLEALGLSAGTEADIADSIARATALPVALPPLVTADVGRTVALPAVADRYTLTLEDGRIFDGYAWDAQGGCTIPAILEPGYHHLVLGEAETLIAVAPPKCPTVPETVGRAKSWGLAAQLYALRRRGDAGIGDFAALAALAAPAARLGAHAISISPVHAQFSADPHRFSPYAPSSRTALNVLHGVVDEGSALLESHSLVDWPSASAFRMARYRKMFGAARQNQAEIAALDAFEQAHGDRLRVHALFEALHAHFFSGADPLWHWQDWPEEFRSPEGQGAKDFAAAHEEDVAFHIWLQFHADRGLAAAQKACRDAGMAIGLISDLAVGTDSGGSQCWSRQEETLIGLSIGAPPDLMQRHGQNWGLTAFSPRGLVANGFGTYREMLHTALAHAGGMRIDHAMGLNRLWVIPEGGSGADGAYLAFPERDLLRLIALESDRNRAIVLAEDLGTVPDGFQDRLREAGIAGMRVLWFERDKEDRFTSPWQWTPRAAAMTSTHDLPTLAGWWRGHDLVWREKLGQLASPEESRAERAHERTLIWEAFTQSGAAAGEPPDAGDTAAFADAACTHVGRSACDLVMLPLEDALALVEQPNLPGTTDEHPNWCRRLDSYAENTLDDGATKARLQALQASRDQG